MNEDKPQPQEYEFYGGTAEEVLEHTEAILLEHVISFDELMQWMRLAGQLADWGYTPQKIKDNYIPE